MNVVPQQDESSTTTSVVDSGKVQLGGQGPIFRKPDVTDTGKVRPGGQGPLFR